MVKFFILMIIAFIGLPIFLTEAKKYEPSGKRVVVFAPHPDDDILGCGGAIIKHGEQGATITIVYMTSGDASASETDPEELAVRREKEAKSGAKKIGAKKIIFLREPDGKLEYSKKNVDRVVELIVQLKPEVIYIPHSKDGHRDHKTTFSIVSKAAEDAVDDEEQPWRIPLILCYEVWTPLQKITHQVDISDVMELKLAALAEHKSQLPSLNIIDAVIGLNRYRGIMEYCGMYGECFQALLI